MHAYVSVCTLCVSLTSGPQGVNAKLKIKKRGKKLSGHSNKLALRCFCWMLVATSYWRLSSSHLACYVTVAVTLPQVTDS